MKSWNGISINHGKKAEEKKSTIEELLKRYSLMIISSFILMSTILGMACFVYAREYQSLASGINDVETAFTDMEDSLDVLKAYCLTEKEEQVSAYETDMAEITSALNRLQNNSAGGNFRRNIRDLEQILDNWKVQGDSLIQIVKNGDQADQVDAAMENLKELQASFRRRKEILYQEIHTHANASLAVIRREMRLILTLLAGAFCSFLLLIIMQMKKLSQEIADPICRLTEQAKQIQTGNIEQLTPNPLQNATISVTEISTMDQAYRIMLDRIQQQIQVIRRNEKIQDELRRQELDNLSMKNLLANSELRCLQMQMNPHFLFNTLNMIRQNAYLGETDKTVALLEETAAYLRYSLDYNGKTVTLQKEIEELGNYVSLQEERFGDRIEFEFVLDESFHQMKIPSMILQPLVENSIIHGMKDIQNALKIRILTEYDSDSRCGVLKIADNGGGIPEDQLILLQKEMHEPNQAGESKIGLHNVYQRLRMFSGGKAQMEIYSTPDVKTEVVMRIPYERGEQG